MTAPALPDLAQAIETEHKAAHRAARTALEHALECGRLLIQAKDAVPHGQWLPWLEANVSFGPRQAQKYMRLTDNASALPNTTPESHLTIEGALSLLAAPKEDPRDAAAWLMEMQRLWAEALPAIEILGTGREIPEYFLAFDNATLRRMSDCLRRMPRLVGREGGGKNEPRP
jgi:hypothetical protein